jgi:glycosyltransferase involved in cell wall biosynthesis
MRIYEDQFIPIFKKVFLFNPEEIKIYKTNNLVWIPHGVNKKVLDYDYQADFRRNLKISFLGKMDYRPNVEAVKWFAQNVLPKLKPQFSFQIIGAFPSKEVLALKNNPRIEVTGFVDDPYRILLESHCVVAPMISGGGIQNKLLESMAIGCVNIVSTICARPLNGINNEIIVSDDPERIAKIINELDPQSEYYQMIQKASKDYIVNNYTWDKYEEVLYKEISL